MYTCYPKNTGTHMYSRAHGCIHCRHTNQICLKCGTLKEERAPACINYSCDVWWGACMCVCAEGWMRQWVCVCVWVEKEKESTRKLRRKQPAIERWHLVWQSEGKGAGLRKERERERERWEAGREEGMYVCVWMCVCERESQGKRNRERHGRTAARISPIAGEGLRGGTGAGILLILSYSRKSCSPARSADYFPCLLPVSSRASGKDRGIRICNHSQQTSTVD